MNDDLISRRALKKALDWIIGNPYVDLGREIMEEIDNAQPVDIKPFALVSFDKDELKRIVDEHVIKPIENGELVLKKEERTGEWIEDDYAGIHCSECDYMPLKDVVIKIYSDGSKVKSGNDNLTPYCPNCGAKMKVKENEE